MRLGNVFDSAVKKQPQSPCLIDGDHCLTYQAAIEALAEHEAWLKTRTLPHRQVVVAYLSFNQVDLFLSILACTRLDHCLPALLNARWTPKEIAAALSSSNADDATILCYNEEFRDTAKHAGDLINHHCTRIALPRLAERRFVSLLTSNTVPKAIWTPAAVATEMERLSAVETSKEDALIVFTSGTTSGSKGVRLSHAAILVQSMAKLQAPCCYSASTKMLATTVPFFHIGGLSSILAVWLAGGSVVLPSQTAGFEPADVIRSMAARRTNTLVVVPAMLYALQKLIKKNPTVFPSVELILIGGQSATPSLIAFLRKDFPSARLVQTYACTEAASSLTFLDVISCHPPPAPTLSGDCVGVAPPHVQLCLLGDDHQSVTEPYRPGIIATRGVHVMNGYWQRGHRPSIRSRDEWLLTNDLGFFDNNQRLYFCGRVSDSIRTGGETVLASDVERALLTHPAVEECAVFGLPDDRFGEAVCAALVGPKPLSLADVRCWCQKEGLSGYKRPRRVFYLSELPRNSSGKVLKFRLKERFGLDDHRQHRSKL